MSRLGRSRSGSSQPERSSHNHRRKQHDPSLGAAHTYVSFGRVCPRPDHYTKVYTMTTPIHVLGISGSLRRASWNTGLLHAASELLPEGMSLEIADMADI